MCLLLSIRPNKRLYFQSSNEMSGLEWSWRRASLTEANELEHKRNIQVSGNWCKTLICLLLTAKQQRAIACCGRHGPVWMLVTSASLVVFSKIYCLHQFRKNEIKFVGIEPVPLLIKIAKKKVPTWSINVILWNPSVIGSCISRIYRM